MVKNKKDGWVYFISNGEYHKVGMSKGSIRDRLALYKSHNPYKIRLLKLIYVSDCRLVENKLQESYFQKEKGETDWKIITQDEIDAIDFDMYSYQINYRFTPKWENVI